MTGSADAGAKCRVSFPKCKKSPPENSQRSLIKFFSCFPQMKTNANIGLAMFLLTAPILLVVFNVPVIRVIRETDSIAKVTLNLNHRF